MRDGWPHLHTAFFFCWVHAYGGRYQDSVRDTRILNVKSKDRRKRVEVRSSASNDGKEKKKRAGYMIHADGWRVACDAMRCDAIRRERHSLDWGPSQAVFLLSTCRRRWAEGRRFSARFSAVGASLPPPLHQFHHAPQGTPRHTRAHQGTLGRTMGRDAIIARLPTWRRVHLFMTPPRR